MINYTITHQVVLEDLGKPQPVDGVEIETRKEREQREALAAIFAQRLKLEMDRQVELAFYYGEAPPLGALPKPEP